MNLVWHISKCNLFTTLLLLPENSKPRVLGEQLAEAFGPFAGNVEDLLSSAEYKDLPIGFWVDPSARHAWHSKNNVNKCSS